MPASIVTVEDPRWLDHAESVLQAGGLLVFPTDTVYGLGASLASAPAIVRLFEIKGRPAEKPIPVLIGSEDQLELVTSGVTRGAASLAARFWPGAMTLILPRLERLPSELGPGATVGVRMPDHPVALELLRSVGPLAVTSANRSGEAEAHTAAEAMAQIGAQVDMILDGGETPGGQASTVVEVSGAAVRILRQGPILEEDLRRALEDDRR